MSEKNLKGMVFGNGIGKSLKAFTIAIMLSFIFTGMVYAYSSSSSPPPGYDPLQEVNAIEKRSEGTPDILLIQTALPWNSSADTKVLNSMSKTIKTIGMTDVSNTKINDYQVVLIVNDQVQSFYDNYAQNLTKFEDYVKNGGVLVFFACDQGWATGDLTAPLPGGVTTINKYENRNYIADTSHSIVTGELTKNNQALTNEDTKSCYMSHGYFNNLDSLKNQGAIKNPKVIFKGSVSNMPTLIEYSIGNGTVIASMNTWEHAYDRVGTVISTCPSEPVSSYSVKALDDVFAYAFSKSGGHKTAGINVQIYPEDLWMPKRPALFKAKSDLIDIVACIKNETDPSQAQSGITLTLKIDSNLVQSDFIYIYKRSSAEELIEKEPVEVNTSEYKKETVDGKVVVTIKDIAIKKKAEQLWNDFVFRFKLSDSLNAGAAIDAEAAVSGDKIETSSQKLGDGGNITIEDKGNIILTNRELLYKVYAGTEDANGKWTINKDNAKKINETFWKTLYGIAADRHAVIYFVDKYDKDGDGNHNNDVKTVKWIDARRNLNLLYDQDTYTKTDQEEASVNEVVNLIDNMLDGRDGTFKDNGFISRLTKKYLWGLWAANPQILILGGDKIIPFYRVFDPTHTVLKYNPLITTHKYYHNSSDVTLTDGKNNYTFSDVIFRDTDGIGWGIGGVDNAYVGRVTGTTIENLQNFLMSSNRKDSSSMNVVKVENNQRDCELETFSNQCTEKGCTVITTIEGENIDVDNRVCFNSWWNFLMSYDTSDPARWDDFEKLFTGKAKNVSDFDMMRLMCHGKTEDVSGSLSGDTYFTGDNLNNSAENIRKTFERFYPIFVFDACLVGLLDDEAKNTDRKYHLLNQLMPLNVGGIYAASGVTNSPRISKYNNIFTDAVYRGYTLGSAATKANQKGGSDLNDQAKASYHSFIMNLFGCPWARVQTPNDRSKDERSSMSRDSRIMSTRDGSSTKSITVDCSSYHSEKNGSFDIVTIDNFDLLKKDTSTPVLPMKDFEVNIPLNATLDKVEVIFNGKTDLGKLNLPAYEPEDPMAYEPTGGYVNCPTGLGLYPQNQYPYRTVNLAEYKTIILTLFPVTFNTDTQETTLYKNAEIRVTYTTPNTGILDSFGTDKDTYGVGESVQTTTVVENISSANQSFTATVTIEDASGNTVKTQAGSNTIASNSVDTVPITLSAPTEQGNYTVIVSVSDGTNVIGGSFKFIQVISGKIVSFQAPAKIKKGDFGTFNISFQNLSANQTDSFNDVYVYNANNERVAKLPQSISTVGSGQTKSSDIQWFPMDSLPSGSYRAFVAVTQGKDVFTQFSEGFAIENAIIDNCPDDPNKTEPGVCGCGVAETPGCGVSYYEQSYVPPANQPPTADKLYVSTDQDKPVSVKLSGSDPDVPGMHWFILLIKPITYSVVTQPQHGTLSGTAPDMTYTPEAGYIGTDSFTFKLSDGIADSAPATVSIVINPAGSMYVDDSLALNISCAEYQGVRYGFRLDYSKIADDPFGLYWKMDISTFGNAGNAGGSCISVGSDLKINVPSALYKGITYQFSLNYNPVSSDASGHYWKMDLDTFKSN